MPRIDAVIFDMDGVLIDARHLHYEALNAALSPFGLEISHDAHLANFDGLSTRQKLAILSETRGLPHGLHTLINELKQKFTLAKIPAHCRPVFHHRYLLARLGREGYRLALCSNSVRRSVDEMIRSADLESFFALTLSNEDIKNPKPAPEIYLSAAARLNVQPDRCLVVEDNGNGIEAARAAGMHVLEVADPDDVTYERVAEALKSIAAKGPVQ
jgi:HAD superfamily hydrolase (TIGR01509 family)